MAKKSWIWRAAKGAIHDGWYVQMFIEDLQSYVYVDDSLWVPQFARPGGTVAYGEAADLLIRLLGPLSTYGPPDDAGSAMSNLYQAICTDQVQFGSAEFAIVASSLGRYELWSARAEISPWKERHYEEEEQASDPSSKVPEAVRRFDISLCRDRRKQMAKVMRALRSYSPPPGMGSNPPLDARGYSLTAHAQASQRRMARLCRSIGWDGRGSFHEGLLDGYRKFQELRFRRLQIELVSMSLHAVNLVTSDASIWGEQAFLVTLPNRQTEADADAMMASLKSGEAGLDDAFNFILPKSAKAT